MSIEERPLFVVDVDLTIYDCFAQPSELVPGSRALLESLHFLGEVRLWSAGGAEHAREVAERFELTELISDYHTKPNYPPEESEAVRILGRVASLQIDDDPTERIGDWPFVHVSYASGVYGKY